MPVNTPTVKLDIEGVRTGGEEWNTGFWVDVPTPITQGDLNVWLGLVATAINTWWSGVRVYASTNTVPVLVRARFYPANANAATLLAEFGLTSTAGTGTTLHPYQCAVVASLRTAVPSRRTRGRMYLPLDAMPMQAAGNYNTTGTASVSGQTATMINSINAATLAAGTATAVIRSEAAGSVQAVTAVVVDSIPDVQRRRANKLASALTTTSQVIP